MSILALGIESMLYDNIYSKMINSAANKRLHLFHILYLENKSPENFKCQQDQPKVVNVHGKSEDFLTLHCAYAEVYVPWQPSLCWLKINNATWYWFLMEVLGHL